MIQDMNFLMILPEIFVLAMACVVLLVDLYIPQKRRLLTYGLTQLTLLGALIISVCLFRESDGVYFGQMIVHDQMASCLKIAIYIASFFVFLFSRDYLEQHRIRQSEFYILGLFSILGMMVLVSGNHLVTLYLGLELMSLPIYAMVALHRDDSHAIEAAIKYFVLGAIASGMLLYGLSMLYGVAHNLSLSGIETYLAQADMQNNLLLIVSLVFIVAGLAFKLGAVPFHMWLPDVYEGSPTAATLFISAAPKIAGFALLVRLLQEALPSVIVQWQELIILLAVLSMFLGNIVAIAQRNIKRMLAYSAIAHGGYMLVGIAAASPEGYAAAMFYTLSYAIMTIGGFGLLAIMSRKGVDIKHVDDLKGLNTRSPWLAFVMLILLFSMAGIPPTVGFFAKVVVIEAVINAHLVWLACVTMIVAVIGSYYYLRVVKVMYFDEPTNASPVVVAADAKLGITAIGLATLVLGILPSALISICYSTFVA